MKKLIISLLGLITFVSCSTDETLERQSYGTSYSKSEVKGNCIVVTSSDGITTSKKDSTLIVSLDKSEMITIRYKYNKGNDECKNVNWEFIGAEIEKQNGTSFEKAVYEVTDNGLEEIDKMTGTKPLVIPAKATEYHYWYKPLQSNLSINEVFDLMF